MAHGLVAVENQGEEIQLLRVDLQNTRGTIYAAIDCAAVQEVIDSPVLQALPDARPPIEGIVEVRGMPVPVLGLGEPARNEGHRPARLVVCALDIGTLALRVARLSGIVSCRRADLLAAPPALGDRTEAVPYDEMIRDSDGRYRFVVDVQGWIRSLLVNGA